MILAASGACKAASPLQLSILGGRPVVDGVYLNRQGSFRFLVDTGAQTNQLGAPLARQLGLTPAFHRNLVTPAGTTAVAGTRIEELMLGSARATNQEFLFTTLDGVHAVSGTIQGVLGQEFLSRFDYLLDVNHSTLDFDATAPAGERIPTAPIDGRPSLQTSLGRLVLDSGSDALILFHENSTGPVSATIRASTGVSTAKTIHALRVTIGRREYKAAWAALVSQPELTEDGLLPLSLFEAVYISNSGNFIVLPGARSGTGI